VEGEVRRHCRPHFIAIRVGGYAASRLASDNQPHLEPTNTRPVSSSYGRLFARNGKCKAVVALNYYLARVGVESCT
jgi:hypothetical protein